MGVRAEVGDKEGTGVGEYRGDKDTNAVSPSRSCFPIFSIHKTTTPHSVFQIFRFFGLIIDVDRLK
jgi:hypothetical protein